ncbi:hypothetical protein AB1Y20_010255 [Prymnesium parvum]|uniref:CNH domain-containing protein n=1 Tax=Prymnesium parvum TaxID=97485 RepID=A0AB34K351_PRYPA
MRRQTEWRAFSLEAALPLHQEVPGGLESLAAHSEWVVVGTSDGQLLLYATLPAFGLSARRSLGCGKKPVESVTVIDPAAEGGLLAVCDAMVWVCQIQDGVQIAGSLPSSKGSSALCVSLVDGVAHVCVGSRRRMQLFRWDGREYFMYQSLELPHTPVTLAWHAEAVVVGFKKASGYAIVRVDALDVSGGTQAATQLSLLPVATPRACLAIVPPQVPPPSLAPPPDERGGADILLGSSDGVGLFVTSKGQPSERGRISWSAQPSCLVRSGPYIVALVGEALQVHSICAEDSLLVQQVPLLHEPHVQGAVRTLASTSEGGVLVGSARSIALLRQLPLPQQLEQLLQQGRPKEASSLLRAACSAPFASSPQVAALPDEGEVTVESPAEGRENGAARLRYPQLELESMSLAVAFFHLSRSAVKPSQLLAIVPEFAPANFTPSGDRHLLPQHGTLRALLASAGESVRSDSARWRSVLSLLADCVEVVCDRIFPFAARHASARALEAEAERQLCIGESLLLQASVEARTAHADRLLHRARVFCASAECAQALRDAQRHSALALLLLHTGEQEQALQIWEALGRGRLEEQEADPVRPTVALLGGELRQRMGLPPLAPSTVLRRSVWVLEMHPAEAKAIFLNPLQSVDVESVIDHLTAVCGATSALLVEYLEWHLARPSKGAAPRLAPEESLERAVRTRLAGLYVTQLEQPAGGEAAAAARARLEQLLESTDVYDAAEILRRVSECPAALDDTSVLMARLGLHREALLSLVHGKRALDRARAYCHRYARDEAQRHDLVCLLLRLLFDRAAVPNRAAGDVALTRRDAQRQAASYAEAEAWADACCAYAVRLIKEQAVALPAERVVGLIPSDLPLNAVRGYFAAVLPHQVHRVHDAQLRRGLARALHQQTQQQLQRLRERRVVVTADRQCQVSGKAIGDAAFAVYPNNSVVLFNQCSRGDDEAVCPVTGRDFALLPIDLRFECLQTD